jgi:uncharacterized protein (TIGR02265 family)
MSGSTIDLHVIRDQLGLATRVREVPLSAHVRGIWFAMAADYVRKMGVSEAHAFRSAVPHRRRIPFLNYSVREYLEELVTAAGIVDPKSPGEGMRRIWRAAASAYIETPFGRSLIRLIRPDPTRYMHWLCEHRDHFCNYGRWSVAKSTEGYMLLKMEREYIWLDYAHRGGAEGMLLVCGVDGTVDAENVGPYDGYLHIRWKPQYRVTS